MLPTRRLPPLANNGHGMVIVCAGVFVVALDHIVRGHIACVCVRTIFVCVYYSRVLVTTDTARGSCSLYKHSDVRLKGLFYVAKLNFELIDAIGSKAFAENCSPSSNLTVSVCGTPLK